MAHGLLFRHRLITEPKLFYCPGNNNPILKYGEPDPDSAGGPPGEIPEDLGPNQNWVQTTYRYRSLWDEEGWRAVNAVSDVRAGPENTVNGSGLNENDEHSVESSDMWLASPVGDKPISITFAFDRVHKLQELLVWNYNVQFELMLGFGIKTALVEYSADGEEWISLGEVELAQASALDAYTANTTISLGGVAAQCVRITVVNGYSAMGKSGLSEVRFLAIPVHASELDPAVGTTCTCQARMGPSRELLACQALVGPFRTRAYPPLASFARTTWSNDFPFEAQPGCVRIVSMTGLFSSAMFVSSIRQAFSTSNRSQLDSG